MQHLHNATWLLGGGMPAAGWLPDGGFFTTGGVPALGLAAASGAEAMQQQQHRARGPLPSVVADTFKQTLAYLADPAAARSAYQPPPWHAMDQAEDRERAEM